MQVESIDGIEGIRSVLSSALENEEKLLRSALSGKPLVYLVGEEFAERYMQERKERGIFLRSLRFSSEQVDLPRHQDHEGYLKEARVLQGYAPPRDSVLIWDGTVAIIDPATLRGVRVAEGQNARMMKGWFDYLWSAAGE